MNDDTEPIVFDAAVTAPLCSCGALMYRDESGVAVNPRLPGWTCTVCVGVFDLSKLNLGGGAR